MGCIVGNPSALCLTFILSEQTPHGRVLQSPVWRVKIRMLGVRAGGLGAERRKKA